MIKRRPIPNTFLSTHQRRLPKHQVIALRELVKKNLITVTRNTKRVLSSESANWALEESRRDPRLRLAILDGLYSLQDKGVGFHLLSEIASAEVSDLSTLISEIESTHEN